MSVRGLPDEENVSEEGPDQPPPPSSLREEKSVGTLVRVLTVLAYLLSVSLAAILLSFYYICVWKSPELPLMNDTEPETSAQRADDVHAKYTHPVLPLPRSSGGSNITMKESNRTEELLSNSSSPYSESTMPTDLAAELTDPQNYTDTPDLNYEDHNNNTANEPTLNITNSIT